MAQRSAATVAAAAGARGDDYTARELASPAAESLLPLADAITSASLDAAPTRTSAEAAAIRRSLFLVHCNVAAYAFFYWVGQPVLPFLSAELGADNTVFSYFQSFNQLVQLVGAPVIGRVIDVRGSKFALLVSHACAALSYALLWQASSVPLLFLSQLPTVFMAAMHSSQAYITHLSSAEERAMQLGRVSLSYGVGFVFGPIVGGSLAKSVGYSNVAAIGMIGSVATCIALWAVLPDIQNQVNQESKDTKQAAAAANAASVSSDSSAPSSAASSASPSTSSSSKGWSAAWSLLSVPSIRGLVLVKFFAVLSLALYRSCFSLVARDHFGLTAQQNGFILSGVGGASMLVNIAAVGWLTARFPDRAIVQTCLALVSASLLASAWLALGRLELLLFYLVPMTLAGAVTAIILTATLTKSSSKADAGAVLGLDMGVGTAARVLAPTLGGWLLELSYEAVGTAAALLALAAWGMAAHGGERIFISKAKAAPQQTQAEASASKAEDKKEL